ncbi:TauD/TfdA family dioxygenase [Variovorax sp. J22R133]|nr:TauD/TfdA family dioxygenase [Variovorax sp. J22R133]MDM0117158.1 TauD/TfdA family dioxygenase [Variovorax sp. J22R133]
MFTHAFAHGLPDTGRKLLFVNRVFTSHVPALSARERDALLEMLYRHIENPRFMCRFRWQANSVAFWDNRCTQHQAIFACFPARRSGYRATINGTRPPRGGARGRIIGVEARASHGGGLRYSHAMLRVSALTRNLLAVPRSAGVICWPPR